MIVFVRLAVAGLFFDHFIDVRKMVNPNGFLRGYKNDKSNKDEMAYN